MGCKGDEVENVPSEYNYEKIECYMQGVRDYIKYIKRGYTRPTHLASIDIRNGRMNRDEGLNQLREYEGKKPLKEIKWTKEKLPNKIEIMGVPFNNLTSEQYSLLEQIINNG